MLCSSLQKCFQCNTSNNFFLNISTDLCELCQLEGCIVCASLYECSDCEVNGYYFQEGLCFPCSKMSMGCYNCSYDGLDCFDCN